MTGGLSDEFNIYNANASEKLTAFIVENILKEIGGEEGEKLVIAYSWLFVSFVPRHLQLGEGVLGEIVMAQGF